MIPANRLIAVAWSPAPKTLSAGGTLPWRVMSIRPLRAQYAVTSKPGLSASGPVSPKPVMSA